MLESQSIDDLRRLFRVGVTDYWRSHYAFGEESKESDKVLQTASLNLLIINTASPLFLPMDVNAWTKTWQSVPSTF